MVRGASNSAAGPVTGLDCDAPRKVWLELSFSSIASNDRPYELQMHGSGLYFPTCSMNGFPIAEEPPVTMSAEKFRSALPGKDWNGGGRHFREPASCRLEQPKTNAES